MREKEFNYSQITKYIYLSSRLYTRKDLEQILRLSVQANVDLEMEKMDRPKDLLAYLWIPVKDFNSPSLEQFFLGVDFIDQLVRRRIKTIVHCNVGYGRAPTLVAAYLMAIKGYSLKRAVTFLSHKRPGVHPSPGQIRGMKTFIRAFRLTQKKSKSKVVI